MYRFHCIFIIGRRCFSQKCTPRSWCLYQLLDVVKCCIYISRQPPPRPPKGNSTFQKVANVKRRGKKGHFWRHYFNSEFINSHLLQVNNVGCGVSGPSIIMATIRLNIYKIPELLSFQQVRRGLQHGSKTWEPPRWETNNKSVISLSETV